MSEAPDLFTWTPTPSDRHGATYDSAKDFARLNRQQRAVFEAMKAGQWMTLREISAAADAPEASVSARIRDFRKPEMSSLFVSVESQRRGEGGTWEYRLVLVKPN